MAKFHYAKNDTELIQFKTTSYKKARELVSLPKKKVYLYTAIDNIEDANNIDREIVVTANDSIIYNAIERHIKIKCDIFIQIYPSYEDAYSQALILKETSPLCYNK